MTKTYSDWPSGSARPQRGFTLVEMMVAMVISIFLSMALTGIYVALKRNFLSEDSIVSTQENQRLALTTLINSIQIAGYYEKPLVNNLASVFLPDSTFSHAGQVVYGATSSGKDSMTVRYQAEPAGGILNCAGAENDTSDSAIFVNTFSVNANSELVCTTTINGESATTVVLARNISKVNFWYGTDADGDGILDSYLNATQAATAGWKNVHSVQVDLTLFDTITATAAEKKPMPEAITQYINMMNTYEIPAK